MDLLNALLAFSVTMLVFSTMAMAIVEVYYRWGNVREKYFEKMIGVLFDELVWPRVKRLVSPVKEQDAHRKKFVAAMVSVSGLTQLDISEEYQQKGTEVIQTKTSAKKRTERLSAVEFSQRFARTECGVALIQAGEEKAKTLMLDLARHLDGISSGSTSNFKQISRSLSLWAAIPLAVLLNVDAIYLFKSYATDRELSERLVKLAPQAAANFEAQQENIKQLQVKITEKSATDRNTINKLLTDTQNSKDELENIALSLQETGVPVGWQYFPYCKKVGLSTNDIDNSQAGTGRPSGLEYADKRCPRAGPVSWVNIGNWVSWLLGLILAIILIGQGSPFWFGVFQKLSWAVQMLRGIGLGRPLGKKPQADIEESGTQSTTTSDPVEAFLVAAKAQALDVTSATPDSRQFSKNMIEVRMGHL